MDEGTIRRYKAELTDEIEPQINELLVRADKGLKALQKREKQLRTKVEFKLPDVLTLLIQARQVEGAQLEQTAPSSRSVNTAGMSKLEARRIQMLVRQRERLEEEMQALRTEVDDMVREHAIHSLSLHTDGCSRNCL